MKIYITKDGKGIENFTLINLKNFQSEMNEVVPNSCTDIVADDIIDFVPHSMLEDFLKILISKLRIGGRLIITGIELGVVSRYVIDETIDEDKYSIIISGKASIHYMGTLIDELKKMNLNIQSAQVKGIKYEISATR